MPPRKRARLHSRQESSASVDAPAASTPAAGDKAEPPSGHGSPQCEEDREPDPWTDEQEIALLKGMIRWKPVGMHKHFRIVALAQHLRSYGHREEHTRIPGLWKKLESLYNLPTLDEREDSLADGTADDGDAGDSYWPFRLPDVDFDELMFARRLDGQRSTSPVEPSEAEEGQASSVEDTEEPRSSPASSRPARGSRRGRGRGAGRRRVRGKTAAPRGRARATPQQSVSEEQEEDEEGEESDEEDEEEESQAERAPTRGGRRGGRGRGGRGRGSMRRGGRKR